MHFDARARKIGAMPYRMPGSRTVIDYAGASATGRHREINEDAWGAVESASVFVVADGGDGIAPGRLAADLAVTSFRRLFSCRELGHVVQGNAPPQTDPLAMAVLDANVRIAIAAVGDSAGMACALIGLRLVPPWLVVTAVGDCRLYRYRRGFDAAGYPAPGELRRLTMDDVYAVDVWKMGGSVEMLTQVEREHPRLVTRLVGQRPDLDVSVTYFPLADDDLYVLCTNGVTRQLDDETIRSIIANDEEALADRCDLLVQTADERSGHDNVTAVLLHVVG